MIMNFCFHLNESSASEWTHYSHIFSDDRGVRDPMGPVECLENPDLRYKKYSQPHICDMLYRTYEYIDLIFFSGWQRFWWASRSAGWEGTQGEYEHIITWTQWNKNKWSGLSGGGFEKQMKRFTTILQLMLIAKLSARCNSYKTWAKVTVYYGKIK